MEVVPPPMSITRGAEILLVLDQAGQTRGIGADDQRLDVEMAARRCSVREVAHARRSPR